MLGPIAVGRKLCGLLAATFAGQVAYAALTYASHWVLAWISHVCFGTWPETPSIDDSLMPMIVGPVFAIPMCILVGLPVWTLVDRRFDRRRRTAMMTGAVVGAAVGIVLNAILDIETGPTLAFYVNEPAPVFGWWPQYSMADWRGGWNRAMAVIDIARFAAAGGLAALIARRTAGVGQVGV
jgi:hypothetical protein